MRRPAACALVGSPTTPTVLRARRKRRATTYRSNRIEACRDVAAEAFERFCELALAALREATPVRQSGGSSFLMAQRPDYAAAPSPRAIEQAKEAAMLISSATSFASRLGAAADIAAGIAREACEKMTSFANDLVTEIRAAEGDERKAAERMLDQTLTIAEPLA